MSASIRLFTFIFLCSLSVKAQQMLQREDIKDKWLVNEDGRFFAKSNASARAVFFWIDSRKEKSNFLCVKGRHEFSIFVNSKLLLTTSEDVKLPVDSIANIYGAHLFVGLFSSFGVHHLQTEIAATSPRQLNDELTPRKGNYFSDFNILAALLLAVTFTMLMRTNPTLTLDYLNVNKLFSFQDRDESTLALRVASSVNLVVYVFCSLLLALLLLITFHFTTDTVWIAAAFRVQTTFQAFKEWGKLSAIIFGVLMLKLAWLVGLNFLFGFRDTIRTQFFNYVRILLIAAIILAVTIALYFAADVRDQTYFLHLLRILSIIFCVGVLVMYFKLLARTSFHFFHLFSYLCASEIIPLMVLIKVFFY